MPPLASYQLITTRMRLFGGIKRLDSPSVHQIVEISARRSITGSEDPTLRGNEIHYLYPRNDSNHADKIGCMELGHRLGGRGYFPWLNRLVICVIRTRIMVFCGISAALILRSRWGGGLSDPVHSTLLVNFMSPSPEDKTLRRGKKKTDGGISTD